MSNTIDSSEDSINVQDPGADRGDNLFAPYKIHKHANQYPLPDGRHFREIAEDIRKHGLRRPIVTTHDGDWIVDGRVRLLACREAGVPPRFTQLPAEYTDEMIWDYVWSSNLYRRHLTSDQRAILAATYAEQIAGEAKQRQRLHGGTAPGRKRTSPLRQRPVSDDPRARETTRVAARKHGVSKDKVQQVITLKKNAPELYKQLAEGRTSLPKAWQALETTRGRGAVDCSADTIAQTVRTAAAELQGILGVFARIPRALHHLPIVERRVVLTEAKAIVRLAKESLVEPHKD